MLRTSVFAAALLAAMGPFAAADSGALWYAGAGGNGHYYEYVNTTSFWPDARSDAASRTPPFGFGPGHLVTISNASENQFLESRFGTDPTGHRSAAWMGFTDEAREGEWRWIDGTPGIWQSPANFSSPTQTAYTDWYPGEPNNSGGHENYGLMMWLGGRQWNDADGSDPTYKWPYVVEYEPQAIAAPPPRVSVSSSGRYLQDASGRPRFLLGYYDWASISPDHYIDQPSRYADMIDQAGQSHLNYIRISAGVNRMTSSTSPPVWAGDPTPVPFAYVNGKADLNQWDPAFWNGLRSQIEHAAQKGVIVHISLFDGVELRGGSESYRWANSFWNVNNQVQNFYGNLDTNNDGSVDEPGEFYRAGDFRNNTGVGAYQRRLIDKLIAETAGYGNVFFEVGNELLSSSSEWNGTVIDYVRKRSDKIITQNGGRAAFNLDGWSQHSANTPAEVKANVAAIVGHGYPAWEDPDGPQLAYGPPDDLRRAAWYSFAGGAAGWGGFSVDFWNQQVNAQTLGYYRNLANFIDNGDVHFWDMTPQPNLVSNSAENSLLAKSGSEYVAYVLHDPSVSVNLAGMSGNASARPYDPRTGNWGPEITVAAGITQTFSRPAGWDDWALYIKLAGGTPPPPLSDIVTFPFASGTEGWTIEGWRSGQYSNGTGAFDGSTGNPSGSIRSSGSGLSNNMDYQTREGTYLTRAISLSGFGRLRIELDLKVLQDSPPASSGTGAGSLLEGSPEDKLVVYYSLSGVGGPWTVAQLLSENSGGLPSSWTRQTIDLSSIPGVINNPNFALRFAWQFNTANDTGWLDNIVLKGMTLVPGDANLDGQVDVVDLGILASHWQAAGFWTDGDFNDSGRIDVVDLGILATNWQTGVSGAASLDQLLTSFGLPAASMPEPVAAVQIALALAAAHVRRFPASRCTWGFGSKP